MPISKDIPSVPPIPQPKRSQRIDRLIEIRLLTPMFGGGVIAGTPDSDMPIRATAIRGHLQFWWRATVGAGFSDFRQLHERHGEVWGRTEKASPIDVQVIETRLDPPVPCGRYVWHAQKRGFRFEWNPILGEIFTYVLFPFTGKPPKHREENAAPEQWPSPCFPSGYFRLRLSFPRELENDIDSALVAWVRFGGLGARTRRGCGSLASKDIAKLNLNPPFVGPLDIGGSSTTRQWPTVGTTLLVGKPSSPVVAWRESFDVMRRFRQDPGFARGPGQRDSNGRPGRSWFPEAESIRKVTGKRKGIHARMESIPDNAFPRAELGLPIVFQFKDKSDGDPFDTVLYPRKEADSDGERMASPIVTKAIDIGDGKAIPAILRLNAPTPVALDLRRSGKPNESLPLQSPWIRNPKLATYEHSPLVGSPEGSAIEALLKFAEQRCGFRRVNQ